MSSLARFYLISSLLVYSVLGAGLDVQPILSCTNILSDGTCQSFWGYESFENDTVVISVNSNTSDVNYFDPSPEDRGQPTSFEPGLHEAVFEVIRNCSDETLLTWNLTTGTATSLPNQTCTTGSCCSVEFVCDDNVTADTCANQTGDFSVVGCDNRTDCVAPTTTEPSESQSKTNETVALYVGLSILLTLCVCFSFFLFISDYPRDHHRKKKSGKKINKTY